ncbi:F-actin-capping protein subunit alpha [Sticta canariensis]|nr:F-actin-capping protein subunit alpha [Sticta canariensis]
MTSTNAAAVSAFVEGAPPGELADVVADIRALTSDDPRLLESVKPAFEKYNEEQLTTAKLPGGGKTKASAVQPYNLDSQHIQLITALQKSLSTHAGEHYPDSTIAIFPTSSDSILVLLLVANKYSPSNFWYPVSFSSYTYAYHFPPFLLLTLDDLPEPYTKITLCFSKAPNQPRLYQSRNGRFRTTYHFTPATASLSGTLKCDVHYYEDGNVRLTTSKTLSSIAISSSSSTSSSSTAIAIAKTIAATEHKYHEELNRGFTRLSEGEFKALRRQLPLTRQKVEWEKIGGYRLGQDLGGRMR